MGQLTNDTTIPCPRRPLTAILSSRSDYYAIELLDLPLFVDASPMWCVSICHGRLINQLYTQCQGYEVIGSLIGTEPSETESNRKGTRLFIFLQRSADSVNVFLQRCFSQFAVAANAGCKNYLGHDRETNRILIIASGL